MNHAQTPSVPAIRRFNRFYTNILGLLERHMLDSEFSLSEVRILYEIGQTRQCTSKKLIEELKVDSGYLSRMIKHFEKQGLTYRVKSKEDGRLYYLYLTDLGKETLTKLNIQSDRQIIQLISALRAPEKKRLVEGMQMIEHILSPESGKEEIQLRSELRPGDAGKLIALHGWVYAQECSYNYEFEGYVCKTFYDFFKSFRPEKDRFWFAQSGEELIGAIAIVGQAQETAQLRWFILHPEYRGLGLGKRLLTEAMDYCKKKGYRTVFLLTTREQQTAIRMYEKAGFQLVAEKEMHEWGKDLVEQTYACKLQ